MAFRTMHGSVHRHRRRVAARSARLRAAATVGRARPGPGCAPELRAFRGGLITALLVWAAIALPLIYPPF